MSYSNDLFDELQKLDEALKSNGQKKKKKPKTAEDTFYENVLAEMKSGGRSYKDDDEDEFVSTVGTMGGENDLAPLLSRDEIIAPIKTTTSKQKEEKAGKGVFQEGNKWYQGWVDKGALEDGYQFGDISKIVLGTMNDNRETVTKAVIDATENLVDAGAIATGTVGRIFSKDFQQKAYDFAAKDVFKSQQSSEWFIDKLNWIDPIGVATNLLVDDTEEASVMGDKADGMLESMAHMVGSAALGRLGVPTWLTQGVNALAPAFEEAKAEGATDTQAAVNAGVAAVAEVLIEKLSGGIVSGTGADDLFLKPIVNKISNKFVAGLVKFGGKTALEGVEEVATEFATDVSKRLTYDKEVFQSEDVFDRYVTTFLSGAFMGMGGNAVDVANTNAAGRNYATGMTDAEFSVVDKLVNDEVAKREANGKKVSQYQKNKIEAEIIEKMENGTIKVEEIEEILGGDSYNTYSTEWNKLKSTDDWKALEKAKAGEEMLPALQKEYDELHKMKRGDMTGEQIDQETSLKSQIDSINSVKSSDLFAKLAPEANRITQLRDKMRGEVSTMVKDSRLAESYRELERSKQAYAPDMTKYTNENAKKTVQNIIDSGLGDNSNAFHAKVDLLAKVSADTGVTYTLTENSRLVGTEHYQEGFTTHGFINDNGEIVINMDSRRLVATTAGHEVGHKFQKLGLDKKYSEILRDYCIKKEGQTAYNKRIEDAKIAYKDKNNTTAEIEVANDLLGEYIFNDENFIKHLSTADRNVFQKVYDTIKYMCKIATAGSEEKRLLEKAKHEFEKAWREISKVKNTNVKTDVDTEGAMIDPENDSDLDYESPVKYSVSVTDPELIDFLENQEHITTYKAMVLIDGKLYPPMASKVKGEDGKYHMTNGREVGEWMMAEEDTTNIKFNDKGVGYYDLKKDEGGTVRAAYNPYEHSSNLVLNDQFEAAYKRDNLVTVECSVPVSEMNGAYKAEHAKDATGEMDWHSGTVASKLTDNKRSVYLSRYLKVNRILSDAEVAQKYKEIVGDVAVPFNVVSPGLLTELEKAGVNIDYDGSPIYQSLQRRAAEREAKKKAKYSVSPNEKAKIDADYLDAVAKNDEETLRYLVREYAKASMPDSKLVTEDGNLREVYHGTNTGDFTVFNPDYIGMSSGDSGFFGMGFYFAYSKGEASYYGAKRVIPAYLDLKNPFNFDRELQTYNGKKAQTGKAPDAVALMNFADKFPDIAMSITLDVSKEYGKVESISVFEFAKAFKDVIENKKFEYQEVENSYGETEILVTADPQVHEYEYNGETHSYRDFGFQKRWYGTPNELDVAYEYLSNSVYSYIDMPRRTNIILDNNEAFTAALKEMGYDGVIQSDYGDEAVAFDPSQIKSAQLITRDDNGEVVPLSKRFDRSQEDIRYSVSKDSDGRDVPAELEELLQFSQVRDENGLLIPMYHGTPNGSIAEFKPGTYFTDNKEYADRYQNPGASSISTGKTVSNPKTFEVYLDIRKPFDLSDPEAKRIYIEEYIKGGNAIGINPYLSDAEYAKINTIDWTEGEDLRDFLIDNDYDYDGLVLDEGADGGYGEDVKYRGKSYVIFDSSQVVRADNTETKYSMSKDSDGNQLTKEQEEFFKDSKMRDANGNLKPMYHGTENAGFHTFMSEFSDDGSSFFFVDSNEVAESYSGTSETYSARTFHTADDFNKFFAEIDAEDYTVAEEDGKFILMDGGDEIATSENAEDIYEEFKDYSGLGFGSANYKTYLNITNPLVIDADERGWNDLPGLTKGKYEYIKMLDASGEKVKIEYSLVDDPAPVVEYVNIDEKFDDNLAYKVSNLGQGEVLEGVDANPATTRDYAQYAKENGYDGVIFENIYDVGGYGSPIDGEATVAIVFDSNQIKSVANTNPTADPDIRYSMSKADDQYMEAVNIDDMISAEKAVEEYANLAMPDSKIRDADGKLLPVYHGTSNMFYEFAPTKEGGKNGTAEGFGIYLSDNQEVTKLYGDRQIKMFANITKPATSFDKTISRGTLVKLIKDTCQKEAQRMVDEDGYGDVREAIRDTWISNYVDTYSTNIEQAYREVAQSILEQNDNDKDIVHEVMFGMAIRDYDRAMEFYRESLTPVTGIDGFITEWDNPNTGETSTIYLAFDSSQLKSADAVTRDDNGNVIPLSERFDSTKKDIRFSISKDNDEYSPYREAPADFGYHDPLDDFAPVRDDVSKAEIAEETVKTEQNVSNVEDVAPYEDAWKDSFEAITDEDAPPVVDRTPVKEITTVEEKVKARIQNTQTELDNNRAYREQSYKDYDEEIARLQAEYNSKKNKNTMAANNLLRRIERAKRMRGNIDADYAKRISDLEKRLEKLQSPEYKTSEQRRAKYDEYRDFWEATLGDTSTWKDKKLGLSYKTTTMRRFLRDVVRDENGKKDFTKADAIYDELETKYDHHEALLKRESGKLKEEFFNLKLNKHEDTYAHMLGEFRHNPQTDLTEDVVKDYYNKHKNKINTAKVNHAIDEARKTFDDLIVRVNKVLKEQGMKEIPYRKGYFPHFQNPKQGFLGKLLNWKPVNTEIPTSIAGLTEQFNPERSWQGFSRQRKGDTTDYSLYQGLDTYIHGALDWIYHIEDIQKRRSLENYIRYTHSEEGVQARIDEIRANETYDADEAQKQIELVLDEASNPLNNLVTELRARTNTLANKKSSMDRGMEEATNRKIYSTMTNINNRVNANMVVGSFSSALTNFIPMVQSWHQVSPLYTVRGLGDFVRSTVKDDGMIARSDYLTNRLVEEEKLYKTGWDKVSDKAAFMMNVIDNITSQTVWRSKYLQNIHEGMSEVEAIKDADQFAKNLMAGRSRGNQPTIFESKNPLIKICTAFQLEVANQYGFMFKDTPQDSKNAVRLVKGYATAFMGAYLYNALYSSITGRDAAFDPIGIMEDLLRDMGIFDDDEEEEPKDIILNFADSIVDELPFVGGLSGGGRIPMSSAMPYDGIGAAFEGIVTDVSEEDYKSIAKEMLNPLYYLIMPIGGGQIKKTVEGLSMFSDDHPVAGSYTDSGALRFPVEDNFGSKVKAGLFGQWANKNARDYIEQGRKPLEEKQLQEYIDLEMPIQDYWEYRDGLKKQETLEDKFDYIAGLDVSVEQKNIMINNIVDRKEDVDMERYDEIGDYDEFDFYSKNKEKYEFLQENGISYEAYTASDESKETYDGIYTWVKNYPNKVTVANAVTDNIIQYKNYTSALDEIRADKDSNGNSISGSAKAKKKDYIFSLDLDEGQKYILFKTEYPKDDTYNYEIIDYLNSREDISYEEMNTILRELGFTILDDGVTITWD